MRVPVALFIVCAVLGCGVPPAEETFSLAEEAQHKAESELGISAQIQDSLFMVAIGHYESLVADHPDHELAEPSLFRVAELHNNGTRRFQSAIDTYRRFLLQYPESPRAPVSLFMIGFLYNNELGDVESAGASYREFLERYPDHELAASASGELDNLGRSPEEIIARQTAMHQQGSTPAESGQPGP
ncbi:MAG: tetratricopeptide repeat protein [Ignavibacteria bacterium]|nr:tetratricopeptide repeat protein [Ignavibacteria bacterium]